MNEKYDVKIEIESCGGNEIAYLLSTHNDSSWSGIRIVEPEHEIPKMIRVLQEYLKNMKERGKNG